MTAMQKLQKAELVMGNYKVGLPLVSNSYNERTPKGIKTAGEICLFVGGVVTIVAGVITPPGWIVIAGGIATLSGRFIAKMFSKKN